MTRTLAEVNALPDGRPKFGNALLTKIFDSDEVNDVPKIGGEVFLALLLEYESGALTGQEVKAILGFDTTEANFAQMILTAIDEGLVTHETLRAVFVLAEKGIYTQAEVATRLRVT